MGGKCAMAAECRNQDPARKGNIARIVSAFDLVFCLFFTKNGLFHFKRYQAEWSKLEDWSNAEYPTSSPVALVASLATSAPKKLLPKNDNVDPNIALSTPLDKSSRSFTNKDVAL